MVSNKKGVILFIVLGVVLIVIILSGVILSVISSHSRLTQHQVSRIRAYYAGKGIMNYALERLRTGDWEAGVSDRYACFASGCLDGKSVFGPAYVIPDDSDIPYKVLVTIHPRNAALGNTVTQLDIKTEYTYTP